MESKTDLNEHIFNAVQRIIGSHIYTWYATPNSLLDGYKPQHYENMPGGKGKIIEAAKKYKEENNL